MDGKQIKFHLVMNPSIDFDKRALQNEVEEYFDNLSDVIKQTEEDFYNSRGAYDFANLEGAKKARKH